MGGSRVTFEWSSEQDTPTHVMEILAREIHTEFKRDIVDAWDIWGLMGL